MRWKVRGIAAATVAVLAAAVILVLPSPGLASRAEACALVAPAFSELDSYEAWDSFTNARAAELSRAVDRHATAIAFYIAVVFGATSESYPGAAADFLNHAEAQRQAAQAAYDDADAARTAAWQRLGQALVAIRTAAIDDYGQSDADTAIYNLVNEAVGSGYVAVRRTNLEGIAETCATAPPLDPCRNVALWRDGERPTHDEITRLYQAVFGRPPDDTGLGYWVDRRSRGASLIELAQLFASSTEWSERYGTSPSPEQVLTALYRNVLGRDPDADGLSFWIGRIRSGWSLAEVLVGFSESAENVQRTGTSAPTSSVDGKVYRLYRAVFGRHPDRCGFAYWKTRLQQGDSLEMIAVGFMGTAEWRSRFGTDVNHAALVQRLYQNVLGRTADAAGAEYWVAALRSGTSVAQVLLAFSESVENINSTGTAP